MSDKYWLTNLAAGEFIHLDVAEGTDVIDAARSHLQSTGLAADVQQGFYVSIYPIPHESSSSETAAGADDGLDEELTFNAEDGVKA